VLSAKVPSPLGGNEADTLSRLRVCLVYDRLPPHTVGGAEEWYKNLAERLADAGHEVTYLTLRNWPRGEDPGVRGVRVVAFGPRMAAYAGGRRRLGPPVVFGLAVLRHLLLRGRAYDVVHTASFPYFSLVAAGLLRPLHRFRLVVDWHEVWTRDYWLDYAGPAAGKIGWAVQSLCLRFQQQAFCFSRLYERRLLEQGVHGGVVVLEGQFRGTPAEQPRSADAMVVFAGRHIPEKQAPALVPAVARARGTIPDLRGEIYGDGTERARVLESIAEHRLERAVEAPGFVDRAVVEDALARALCLVLPSRREGYGLVVLEAIAHGTPAVVVAGPDNAATELIADAENGFVAPSASPEDLAAAILKVHEAGHALRESTLAWFKRNALRLSLAHSLEVVLRSYSGSGR
jgi:glycosyltransferase involved in cell wall biosynthesis